MKRFGVFYFITFLFKNVKKIGIKITSVSQRVRFNLPLVSFFDLLDFPFFCGHYLLSSRRSQDHSETYITEDRRGQNEDCKERKVANRDG